MMLLINIVHCVSLCIGNLWCNESLFQSNYWRNGSIQWQWINDTIDITTIDDVRYSSGFIDFKPATQHQFNIVAYTSEREGEVAELTVSILADGMNDNSKLWIYAYICVFVCVCMCAQAHTRKF